MKQFGNWMNPAFPKTETPVGQGCLYCQRVIQAGDKGVTMPLVDGAQVTEPPWHRECLLRNMFGPDWESYFN